MSLLNQMLKDLEKRQQSVKNEMILSGLASATINPAESSSKLWYALCGIAISAMIMISIKNISVNHNLRTYPQTEMLLQQSLIDPTPPSNLLPPPVLNLPHVVLSGISLTVNEDVTDIAFNLNQGTTYRIATDATHQELILTLENASMINDMPPVDYLKSALKGMELTMDQNKNLIIHLTLHTSSILTYLNLDQAHNAAQLHLKINYHQPAKITKPEFSIQKTAEFNIKENYENALNLSQTGEPAKAIKILTHLLKQAPDYAQARGLLVDLYQQADEKDKASTVLAEGLKFSPQNATLIEIKARLLMNQGRAEDALTVLQSAPPAIESDPDYHAFMAALYQQNGQPQTAEQIYNQLVHINPNKAAWWTGLGIALESLGKNSEAKEVYMQAVQLEGLNPELSNFLQTRIQSI